MRCLELEKKTVWYCPYIGKNERITESGLHTGEYIKQFGKAVPFKCNVLPVRSKGGSVRLGGIINELDIGLDLNYSRILISDDPNLSIKEEDVLFLDKKPKCRDNYPLYDYRIVAIVRSLNVLEIAANKVESND